MNFITSLQAEEGQRLLLTHFADGTKAQRDEVTCPQATWLRRLSEPGPVRPIYLPPF